MKTFQTLSSLFLGISLALTSCGGGQNLESRLFEPLAIEKPEWQESPQGAYRADGARGQYIMILPDSDAVIAVTADSPNLQGEQNLIYKYIFPVLAELK